MIPHIAYRNSIYFDGNTNQRFEFKQSSDDVSTTLAATGTLLIVNTLLSFDGSGNQPRQCLFDASNTGGLGFIGAYNYNDNSLCFGIGNGADVYSWSTTWIYNTGINAFKFVYASGTLYEIWINDIKQTNNASGGTDGGFIGINNVGWSFGEVIGNWCINNVAFNNTKGAGGAWTNGTGVHKFKGAIHYLSIERTAGNAAMEIIFDNGSGSTPPDLKHLTNPSWFGSGSPTWRNAAFKTTHGGTEYFDGNTINIAGGSPLVTGHVIIANTGASPAYVEFFETTGNLNIALTTGEFPQLIYPGRSISLVYTRPSGLSATFNDTITLYSFASGFEWPNDAGTQGEIQLFVSGYNTAGVPNFVVQYLNIHGGTSGSWQTMTDQSVISIGTMDINDDFQVRVLNSGTGSGTIVSAVVTTNHGTTTTSIGTTGTNANITLGSGAIHLWNMNLDSLDEYRWKGNITLTSNGNYFNSDLGTSGEFVAGWLAGQPHLVVESAKSLRGTQGAWTTVTDSGTINLGALELNDDLHIRITNQGTTTGFITNAVVTMTSGTTTITGAATGVIINVAIPSGQATGYNMNLDSFQNFAWIGRLNLVNSGNYWDSNVGTSGIFTAPWSGGIANIYFDRSITTSGSTGPIVAITDSGNINFGSGLIVGDRINIRLKNTGNATGIITSITNTTTSGSTSVSGTTGSNINLSIIPGQTLSWVYTVDSFTEKGWIANAIYYTSGNYIEGDLATSGQMIVLWQGSTQFADPTGGVNFQQTIYITRFIPEKMFFNRVNR